LGAIQVSVYGVKINSRLLRPDKWVSLLVVFALLPFDFLVALSLWISELFYLPIRAFTRRPVSSQKPNVEHASIIILNWDGRHLLQEFLPSVLKAVKHDGRDHEVIVVDNGSQDESISFLKDQYPQVKVVALSRNMRFTGGNNAGVQAARNDIVIFLNNDMEVDPGFIAPLLRGFEDKAVFAVSCQVFFQDRTRRREETGKTRALWRLGFVELYHDQITDSDRSRGATPIFWAGGGSCALDRKKFLAIQGLDTLYDPFYLEDTDLSYQAWKRGWRSLLASDSVAVHKHRGTNKLKFGDNYVDNTIRKNQYLFIWKNITDFRCILAHGLLLPFIQARLIWQTHWRFELRAFFRALIQLPEALVKRYRHRGSYVLSDSQIFDRTSTSVPKSGESGIDFSAHDFLEQLGPGWHEREEDGAEGFRWMSRKASLFLFAKGHEQALEIRGAVPDIRNIRRRILKLRIYQEKQLLFTKRWLRPEKFQLSVPLRAPSCSMFRFDLELNRSFCPARSGLGEDTRELGIIVSQIRLV
jgi:GT2 family glycosyltransferase